MKGVVVIAPQAVVVVAVGIQAVEGDPDTGRGLRDHHTTAVSIARQAGTSSSHIVGVDVGLG